MNVLCVLCVASPSIYDSSLRPIILEGKKYRVKKTIYKLCDVYYELKEHKDHAYKACLFMPTSNVNEIHLEKTKVKH